MYLTDSVFLFWSILVERSEERYVDQKKEYDTLHKRHTEVRIFLIGLFQKIPTVEESVFSA